ncbi:MAG: hypothetical protein ACE5HE_14160, partial [Phycisphaerae bacterium]
MGKGGGKLVALAIAFTSVPPAVAQTHTPQVDPRRSNRSVHIVHQGIIYINLAEDVLNAWGWSAVASSELGDAVADGTTRGGVFEAAFPINISSSPLVVVDDRRLREVRAARFTSSGALVLSSGSFRSVIGGLTVEGDRTAGWQVKSTLGRSDGGVIVFELHDLFVDFREGAGRLLLLGELTIAEGWATQVGVPQVAGMPVGTVLVDAEVVPDDRESVRTPTVSSEADGALDTAGAGGSLRTTTGPDVIVGDLHQVESYGSFGLSDVSACAVGT